MHRINDLSGEACDMYVEEIQSQHIEYAAILSCQWALPCVRERIIPVIDMKWLACWRGRVSAHWVYCNTVRSMHTVGKHINSITGMKWLACWRGRGWEHWGMLECCPSGSGISPSTPGTGSRSSYSTSQCSLAGLAATQTTRLLLTMGLYEYLYCVTFY